MSKLSTNIAKLSEQETYSLLSFALFKLRGTAEYATLSEMSWILDTDSFLKLCEFFGGLTIKIPTIEELESLTYSLVLYQKVNVEGEKYEDVLKTLGTESEELRKIKSDYEKIVKIMSQYDFTRGDKNASK